MNCPRCDYTLERHTPIAGEGTPWPEPGDLTLCLGCGALLAFDGIRIREATPEETREAIASVFGPQLARARELIVAYRRTA